MANKVAKLTICYGASRNVPSTCDVQGKEELQKHIMDKKITITIG
jgi:hypothetical protein